jgi:hypothetical protein
LHPQVRYSDDEDTTKGTYKEYDDVAAGSANALLSYLQHDEIIPNLVIVIRDIASQALATSEELALRASLCLFKWNEAPADSTLDTLLTRPYSALQIIYELDSTSKQTLLNKHYRSQQAFAGAYLQNWLSDDEYAYDSLEFVFSKAITHDTLTGRIYLFCYNDTYEQKPKDQWRTALIGMFPLDTNRLTPQTEFIRVHGKRFSTLSAEQHIEYLIHRPSRYDDEEDDD